MDAAGSAQSAAVLQKLHWHIMPRFCLLTILNHLDRANLAYASVQMNRDLGFSDNTYGIGSGVFFIGYMAFQIPSHMIGERIGLPRWIGLLMVGWGITATLFAGLSSNPLHLYILRFFLGAFEAGTFPCMWAHLTHFYAGGPELAAAWGFIGTAQPVAQVLGAPLAAALLLADGLGGLRGWQWLFLLEGLPTIVAGGWLWATLAPEPLQAKCLEPAEREWAHHLVKSNKEDMADKAGQQDARYALRCWKVYAQGFASGWAGVTRYAAMYWTPLIVANILGRGADPAAPAAGGEGAMRGAVAVLLAGIPYGWSALATLLNSQHAKKTGEMYWHCVLPLACASVGLVGVAALLGGAPWAALGALTLAATSQASNPLEWSYPATYLAGEALKAGWTIANCVANFGGVVGPALVGAAKQASGSYQLPMLLLAGINAGAVLFFAVLLRVLPAKDKDEKKRALPADVEPGDGDAVPCLPAGSGALAVEDSSAEGGGASAALRPEHDLERRSLLDRLLERRSLLSGTTSFERTTP